MTQFYYIYCPMLIVNSSCEAKLVSYKYNKSFISDNSPYGYKKMYKTHIINKLKIIRTNGNQ